MAGCVVDGVGKYRVQWQQIPSHLRIMAISLVLSYLFFQVLTAAFDWDNSPRRAFALIFLIFRRNCLGNM